VCVLAINSISKMGTKPSLMLLEPNGPVSWHLASAGPIMSQVRSKTGKIGGILLNGWQPAINRARRLRALSVNVLN